MALPIVETYALLDNSSPLEDWLDGLRDRKTRAVIKTRINRLRNGNFGDAKPITDVKDLFELRIDFGPGYRVYFYQAGPRVVLLNGGDKDDQNADIRKAEKYMKDYISRRRNP